MNKNETARDNIERNMDKLEHLKISVSNGEYEVSLIDTSNYEIVRGYGKTIIEAINDLHSNLV